MAKTRFLVAIGDLHGHYPALDALITALERRGGVFRGAGSHRLLPGVTMVFTGDYIDRGASALSVIDRLRRLQELNPGQVVTLLGNHELLALQDLDVARTLAATDPQGGLLRYEFTDHGSNGGCEFVAEFAHDGGHALPRYVERMSRGGDVGSWMRALRPSFETGIAGRRFLFTHGDIPEGMLSAGAVSRYGQEVSARMAMSTYGMGGASIKFGDSLFTSARASYFWCRDFQGLRQDATGAAEAVCRRAGVDFVVTGHTMHRGRIVSYGGRIFDIDVGMTPAYGRNLPQALIATRRGIAAFDATGGENLLVPFESSVVSRRSVQ